MIWGNDFHQIDKFEEVNITERNKYIVDKSETKYFDLYEVFTDLFVQFLSRFLF